MAQSESDDRAQRFSKDCEALTKARVASAEEVVARELQLLLADREVRRLSTLEKLPGETRKAKALRVNAERAALGITSPASSSSSQPLAPGEILREAGFLLGSHDQVCARFCD